MKEKGARIINLYGGPGCSKSTTAAGIFSVLKLHGVNCELCTEYAKDLTWESRNMTLQNQIYIFGKQYHRLWRVVNQVDVVITDSPILLSNIYDTNNDGAFRNLVLDTYNKFNNYNFFLERAKKYNPSGRSQSLEEAINVDSIIKRRLDEYKITHKHVIGDYSCINSISMIMLDELSINNRFSIAMV